jgi:tRNA A-37 threonylcarbamoyl transferase component Bud32
VVKKKVYKGCLTPDSPPILLKYRFRKNYRHSALDASLTKMRVAGEARALLKCLRYVLITLSFSFCLLFCFVDQE